MNAYAHFKPDDRVQTHPATDTWMRGDRYGTVTKVTFRSYRKLDPRDSFKEIVHVKMDRSGKVIKFHPSNLMPVEHAL